MSAAYNSADAQLRLEGWKNLSPKKDKEKEEGVSSSKPSQTVRPSGR